jgi:hypothetical protein
MKRNKWTGMKKQISKFQHVYKLAPKNTHVLTMYVCPFVTEPATKPFVGFS